jgi:hypothetical protein
MENLSPTDLIEYFNAVFKAAVGDLMMSKREFSNTVWPSQIAPMFCAKRNVLTRYNNQFEHVVEPTDDDYSLALKMQTGRVVEEIVGGLLRNSVEDEITIEMQVPVKVDRWSGSIDFLVNEEIPVEVKYTAGDSTPTIKEYHIYQLAAYLYAMGFEQGVVVVIGHTGAWKVWSLVHEDDRYVLYSDDGAVGWTKYSFLPGSPDGLVHVKIDDLIQRYEVYTEAIDMVNKDPEKFLKEPGEHYNPSAPSFHCVSKKKWTRGEVRQECPFWESCYGNWRPVIKEVKGV